MGACKAVCVFFPTCQVRVVRFYVSCPAFSFFSSFSSSAGPQLQWWAGMQVIVAAMLWKQSSNNWVNLGWATWYCDKHGYTRIYYDIQYIVAPNKIEQWHCLGIYSSLSLSLACYIYIYIYKLRRFKIETCPFDLVGWFTVYLWQIIFPNYIDYQMVFWISDFLQHNKDWSWTTAAASSDDRWSGG